MTNYREMDDGTLVDLALLREDGAFEELVERHEGEVKKKAVSIIGNPYTAEDIAQDTFLYAWSHLAELRYRPKFGIWILRVAENRAKTLLKRYKTCISELVADPDSIPVFDEDSRLSLAIWEETEQNQKIRDAVDALSRVLRDTVLLHYLDGYSVKEVSTLLSVPEGTVLWRLSEGRKQLRRGFGVPEEGVGKLTSRVKRQIEELKRWATRNDKSGFAETYGSVLSLVGRMEDSAEKSAMLADVLLRGMWWIPGQDNERLRAKIKAAALASHNEYVMASLIWQEYHHLRGKNRIRRIRDVLIPEMEAAGFVKPLGQLYLWLGQTLAGEGETDDARAAFLKVADYLPTDDAEYASSLASLEMEPRYAASDPLLTHIACIGETYVKEGNRWLFMSQPGYTRGITGIEMDALVFYWLSRCDGIIDDTALMPGSSLTSEDGRVTLALKRADGPVTVPAGTYGSCLIFETKGENDFRLDIETVVCPGVGIIQQTDRIRGTRFLLTSADVRGGGRIPFAAGNRWTYHAEKEGGEYLWHDEQTLTIVHASEKRVTVSFGVYAEAEYDRASWLGNIRAAKSLYYRKDTLYDVEDWLRRAEELASTPREKAHTEAAADVMRRIFRTDPVFNPLWTERGVFNFFKPLYAVRTGGNVTLNAADRSDAFEWKGGGKGAGFHAVLYNYLYEIVANAGSVLWSDAWIPGYADTCSRMLYNDVTKSDLTVLEDEDVRTPAGEFTACRHVAADTLTGIGYWGGHLEFWYAESVGLVKFLRIGTAEDEPEDGKAPVEWELTEYRGTGKGFFPLNDGLLRRYEPAGQPLPDGYRGWVEYTFSTDETGTMIFKNACGVQERHEAEKSKDEE